MQPRAQGHWQVKLRTPTSEVTDLGQEIETFDFPYHSDLISCQLSSTFYEIRWMAYSRQEKWVYCQNVPRCINPPIYYSLFQNWPSPLLIYDHWNKATMFNIAFKFLSVFLFITYLFTVLLKDRHNRQKTWSMCKTFRLQALSLRGWFQSQCANQCHFFHKFHVQTSKWVKTSASTRSFNSVLAGRCCLDCDWNFKRTRMKSDVFVISI